MKFNKVIIILIFLLAVILRFYKLSSNPPSLYWEEAALGYDAYSILKTGKDFHGNRFPLVAFESFGDWKPSLYFYTLVPSIGIFGLNEFAVRFPSAFFGSLTVLLTYFLVKELFIKNSNHQPPITNHLPIISMILLAISPWHLQFSRAGFEVNLSVFLIVLGAYLFLKAVNKNIYFLLLSALSFSLSLYAYHAARVFTPLLAISLGLIFSKKFWKRKKTVLISLFLALVLISPIIKEYKNPAVQSRLQTTSAFATLDPILESNKKIREDGNTFLARVIHHRLWHYGKIFLDHYFDHFHPEFLFFKGDLNPRHSTGEVGLLYLIEAPFLLAGVYFIFMRKQRELLPVLVWLVLAPIPAGFTKATPHALRFLISIPCLQILTAYGIVNCCFLIRSVLRKTRTDLYYIFSCFLFSIFCFLFLQYLHFYYKHYPNIFSQHWQYGYKEMINYVLDNQDKYENIYISREQGRPSIYYFFFGQIDPKKVQIEEKKALKDQGELLEFGNIKFFLPPREKMTANSLVVMSGEKEFSTRKIRQIDFLNGDPAFKIYEN